MEFQKSRKHRVEKKELLVSKDKIKITISCDYILLPRTETKPKLISFSLSSAQCTSSSPLTDCRHRTQGGRETG